MRERSAVQPQPPSDSRFARSIEVVGRGARYMQRRIVVFFGRKAMR